MIGINVLLKEGAPSTLPPHGFTKLRIHTKISLVNHFKLSGSILGVAVVDKPAGV